MVSRAPSTSPLRALLSRLRTPDLDPSVLRARHGHACSKYLDLAGRTLHVIDEGRGPALLLIHGTGSSARTWDGWAEHLRLRYRVVRPDLPGFGLTGSQPWHGHSMGEYADTLHALLDALDVREVCVAGNSLGGQIACHMAARRPERVKGLVLVCPGGFHRRAPGPFKLTVLPLLGPALREITPWITTATGLAFAYANPLRIGRETLDRYHELLLYPGNRDSMFDSLAIAPVHADMERTLEKLRSKTLVMWGAHDRFTLPAEARRFMAHLKDAELVMYPDLGHVPQEEAPDRTCQDAERFLDALNHRAPDVP